MLQSLHNFSHGSLFQFSSIDLPHMGVNLPAPSLSCVKRDLPDINIVSMTYFSAQKVRLNRQYVRNLALA